MTTKQFTFYMIECKDPIIIGKYIGQTTNFSHRSAAHKSACNNTNIKAHNEKKYVYIRENGGWDNWTIEILDIIENITINNAHKKEQELIDKYGATLNEHRAIKKEEKLKEPKESKNQYMKDLMAKRRADNADTYNDKKKTKQAKKKNAYTEEDEATWKEDLGLKIKFEKDFNKLNSKHPEAFNALLMELGYSKS